MLSFGKWSKSIKEIKKAWLIKNKENQILTKYYYSVPKIKWNVFKKEGGTASFGRIRVRERKTKLNIGSINVNLLMTLMGYFLAD